jgi:two-component system, NarL family, sensor histidine kinase DevS
MAGPDDKRTWDQGALAFSGLARVRLDTLLHEVLSRVDEVMESQDRLCALLDAVLAIGADLDLNGTLDRIVAAACELSGARYGALGVVGRDGRRFARFITHGISDDEIARIGPLPQGHGLLGLLIDRPEPLRLADLAEHPRSYGFPANHPPMKSFLGVPIRSGDNAYGNLYLTEKGDGAEFTADDERAVTALATAAGVVIDNARLYAESEHRRQWHEVTAEITQFVLGDFDQHEVLQLIATRAREVSGSIIGGVLLVDGDELVLEALDSPAEYQHYLGTRMSLDRPILGDVLHGDEQVVIEDLAELAKQSGRIVDLPDLANLGRTLLAPLPHGVNSAGGVLIVAARRGATTVLGNELMQTFASQATLALDRAQAQRAQATLAVLEDRDRIARDLHDLVIQRLFATGLQLQGIHRLVTPEVQARIGRAVEDIDTTIRDLRTAIFELHHRPDKQSLRADLQQLVDEYADPLGFRPEFRCVGPVDSAVSAIVRPQIMAAVRESLSNVVRHARASAVLVEVSVDPQWVVARVSDNGVGLSGTGRESGLRNLRERAERLGGSVRLATNQPHGTVLELRAPLDAQTS